MRVAVAALLGLLVTAAIAAPHAAVARRLQSSQFRHLEIGLKSKRNVPGPLTGKPPLTTRDVLTETQLEARQSERMAASGKLGRRTWYGISTSNLVAMAQKLGGKPPVAKPPAAKPTGSATVPALEWKPNSPNVYTNEEALKRKKRQRKAELITAGAAVTTLVVGVPLVDQCSKGKLGCDDEATAERKWAAQSQPENADQLQ